MSMKHWEKIILVIFNNNNLYDTSINAIVIHNLTKVITFQDPLKKCKMINYFHHV